MKLVFALLVLGLLPVCSFSQSSWDKSYAKQFLALKSKVQFDITYYMDGGDIKTEDLKKIQDSIKLHCPVKQILLAYEAVCNEGYQKLTKELQADSENIRDSRYVRLYNDLKTACNTKVPQITFLPCYEQNPKLILYIVY